MKNILISGGSGLIGRHLGLRLKERGYQVAILSRSSKSDSKFPVYQWNPDNGELDDKALDHADIIVHLAGVNIGERRWTPSRKQHILNSRIRSGELLLKAIEQRERKPVAFISSSAIGYYGAVSTDTIFEESAPAHSDFLGQTCKSWEELADRFEKRGVRAVKIRTGVVLSRQGGAFSKLSLPIRYGVGAPIGSGKQFMPWIHIEDLCRIFIHAIEHPQMAGAYNAVAPEHITNRDLTTRIARGLGRPLWIPNIPAGVLRLFFGEMSAMLLKGSRVSSEKIIGAGFNFLYPDIDSAIQDYISEQSG